MADVWAIFQTRPSVQEPRPPNSLPSAIGLEVLLSWVEPILVWFGRQLGELHLLPQRRVSCTCRPSSINLKARFGLVKITEMKGRGSASRIWPAFTSESDPFFLILLVLGTVSLGLAEKIAGLCLEKYHKDLICHLSRSKISDCENSASFWITRMRQV